MAAEESVTSNLVDSPGPRFTTGAASKRTIFPRTFRFRAAMPVPDERAERVGPEVVRHAMAELRGDVAKILAGVFGRPPALVVLRVWGRFQ